MDETNHDAPQNDREFAVWEHGRRQGIREGMRAATAQRLVALLAEARNTRAADIVPNGWADRVDAVLQEMNRG